MDNTVKDKKEELKHWIGQYTGELYNWAYHKVSDAELAKDLVQDTFVAALEKLDDFKGDSAPKTWLFAILNFKIIDVYRKKSKMPVAAEASNFADFFDGDGDWHKNRRPKHWDEDSHLLDDDDFREVLKKCLELLPEKWKACVKMKYMLNKKGDEICQELEITDTNFWQIMHRSKLNLRECIDTNWFKN